jgi:hypothetical protein
MASKPRFIFYIFVGHKKLDRSPEHFANFASGPDIAKASLVIEIFEHLLKGVSQRNR